MKLHAVVLAGLLASCDSTTGVVPVGQTSFMIAREDNGSAASLGALKAATYQEGGASCAGQAKTMQVTKESDTPRSLGQFPQTTLQFQFI
jgi:hypothetical protein